MNKADISSSLVSNENCNPIRGEDEQAVSPLSEAQLGIWLGHQRATKPSVYNAAQCVLFAREVEFPSLHLALARTLFEAEALHRAFEERRGMPVSVPLFGPRDASARYDHCLSRIRWGTVTRANLLEYADGQLEEELRPERGELFSHRLLRLDDGRIAWLHIAHHLALDGYGFSLITRRVIQNYERLSGELGWGEAFSELLPVIAADQEYQKSPKRMADERYFDALLRAAPRGAFPSRPASARPLRRVKALNQHLIEGVERSARKRGLSVSDLLLAAAARATAACSKKQNFTLGIPLMLRWGTPAAKTPCMAMNIVPIVCKVSPSCSLLDIAKRLSESVREAKAHQNYRYEHLPQLLDEQQLFSPVVNIMPSFGTAELAERDLEVLQISPGPVQDLFVSFVQESSTWQVTLFAHPALFTQEVLEDLLSEIVTALENREAKSSPYATSGRYETSVPPLFDERNGAGEPPPVLTTIARNILEQPDALALISRAEQAEQAVSYRVLGNLVQYFVRLLEPEVHPRSIVAIDMASGVHSIAILIAIVDLGCAYLALDPKSPPARREQVLDRAAPSLVVTDREDVRAQRRLLVTDDKKRAALRCTTGWQPRPTLRDSTAYVVFTSGSTGLPKGIQVSTTALDHFTAAARRRYAISKRDAVLQFASLAFDASVEEIFVTLSAGATLVLSAPGMLESTDDFLRSCEGSKVSVLDLPTAYFHELCHGLSRASPPWKELRTVIVGGEALRPFAVEQFAQWGPGVCLINSYGPSEATVVATTAVAHPNQVYENTVPIGRPLEGVGAVVLDVDGNTIEEPFLEGELVLFGPTLAKGYLDDEAETTKRFLHIEPWGRCYRTGDRACFDFQGRLLFCGRIDEQLKISGHRVHPSAIQRLLCQHPSVSESLVWGARSAEEALFLEAAVEVPTGSLDVPWLIQQLRLDLPAAMIPSTIHVFERFVRTTNGKIDRFAVQAAARRELGIESSRPEHLGSEDTTLAMVQGAFKQVLDRQQVEPDDDFFALGGSSLQAIALASRLQDRGLFLRVSQIFQASTPLALTRLLGESGHGPSTERSVASPPPPEDACVLAPVFLGEMNKPLPAPSADGSLLLTGATGFLGVHLLTSHLAASDEPVVCLIRARDEHAARARLRHQLERFGLDDMSGDDRVTVVPLPGSKTHTREVTLRSLPRCTRILHAAANVKLTRSYRSLLDDNVIFTRELLELGARQGAVFHYVSTLSTVGPPLTENDDLEQIFGLHLGLHDGYQQSKCHAEMLCANARAAGYPVVVHRLGRVTGPRARPSVNPQDIVWQIARAANRMRLWPRLDITEIWSPVDDLAHDLVQLVRHSKTASQRGVYHLTNNGPFALETLCRALKNENCIDQAVPLPMWLTRLRHSTAADDRALLSFFEIQSSSGPEVPSFGPSPSVRGLLSDNERSRSVDEELATAYVRSALSAGVFS